MSLLDFLNTDDAKLGLGLLAAGGPSSVPMNIGQRVQGVMQGLSADRDAEIRRQYVRSQMEENAAQTQARQIQIQRDQEMQGFIMRRLQGRGDAAPQAPGMMQPQAAPGGAGMAPGVSSMGAAGMQPQQGPAGGMAPGMTAGGAPAGGAFPFGLTDLAVMQVGGVKGTDNLFNMYKYATDGVKREGGAYYLNPTTGERSYYPKLGEGQVIGPDGMVSNAPGYVQANAGSKGLEVAAIEGAKFPYAVATDRARQTTAAAFDMVPVERADGNTYYEPRLNMATGAGSGAPGGSGAGDAAGAPASGGFMSKRNPITQQSQIAINENWLKNAYQPTIEAGKVATDLDNSIQALRTVDIKTGWGTEAKASAASFLAGLGVSAGNAGMYAANAQKFQSIAMEKLQTSLSAQKGMQTEGDADRAKQTFVSLRNTPEANAFILDFAQAKANADKRRAQYYEQALPLAQKQGDLTRINREWGKVQGSIWSDPLLQKWAK